MPEPPTPRPARRPRRRTPVRAVRLVLLLALFLGVVVRGSAAAQSSEPLVVFAVRHAERADDGSTPDPSLSDEGRERARTLAGLLADAELDAVHVTRYRRTAETAAPTTERLGLATATYDPGATERFVADLRARGGRHLVVGHSNTIPELVRALGGDPGTRIAEDEYDRLYVLAVWEERTSTMLLRFGATTGP